ncbi:hypothetical protein Aduo_015655 [Ancylostoma duodenale]
MSKFGSVKSKITTAINHLNRTLARIDPSYLRPFSSEGSLRSQSRKLSKPNGGMIRARNTIRSALDVLDKRYEAVQLFISKQEDQGTLAHELCRHWEDLIRFPLMTTLVVDRRHHWHLTTRKPAVFVLLRIILLPTVVTFYLH